MRKFIDIVCESIAGLETDILTRRPSERSIYAIYDEEDERLDRLVSQYRSGVPVRPWKIVPAARLIKIWRDAARMGFVRDEKGIDEIAKVFIENTALISLNNDISGHSHGGEEKLDEYFDDEEERERFVDWAIATETGAWRISDYGIGKLIHLARLLSDAETADEKLVVIDAMMQVTHPRSDLASWFVEGGSRTFDALFEQPNL